MSEEIRLMREREEFDRRQALFQTIACQKEEIARLTAEGKELREDLSVARQSLYEVVDQRNKFIRELAEARRRLGLADESLRVIKEVAEQFFPDDTQAMHALKVEIPDICDRARASLPAKPSGGDRDNFEGLYPRWNCPKCGDWFHMPWKFCKCAKPEGQGEG